MCVCVFSQPFLFQTLHLEFFPDVHVKYSISHGCVKHYICCIGLRGDRCNARAHACKEVSRGLALFPAGEDTHAALCLVWADSHLELAWNRPARVAVQCEMNRHSCWIKIKNKKLHPPSLRPVLWSPTAKHFSVGPRSPTHTNTKLSQYVSSVLQTAQQFFIVSVQKKIHNQKKEINTLRLRGRVGQTRSKNLQDFQSSYCECVGSKFQGLINE